jgi:hypothetical protein
MDPTVALMREQYITRLLKCTAEPMSARRANATSRADAQFSAAEQGSAWSRMEGWVRSPMALPKEPIFLL